MPQRVQALLKNKILIALFIFAGILIAYLLFTYLHPAEDQSLIDLPKIGASIPIPAVSEQILQQQLSVIIKAKDPRGCGQLPDIRYQILCQQAIGTSTANTATEQLILQMHFATSTTASTQ